MAHQVEEIQSLYQSFKESTDILKENLGISMTDAWLETAENIIDGGHVRLNDGWPDEKTAKQLEKIYAKVGGGSCSSETMRSAIQYILLQIVKEDYIQPNHQLTPDAIGLFFVYFVQLFLADQDSLSILNLGIGTGNLLSLLMNQLADDFEDIQAYGIDIDETQLALASVNFALQGTESLVKLYHQDVLRHLYVPPVDLVVSDLPVGYYPDDDTAQNYQAAFQKGHSYAHYLFIEQGMNYLNEAGFGFFLIPSQTFNDPSASHLIRTIQAKGYLQAVIQLPDSFFRDRDQQKSILIVQNKGNKAKQAKEVLFAQIPDLSSSQAAEKFLEEVKVWQQSNL